MEMFTRLAAKVGPLTALSLALNSFVAVWGFLFTGNGAVLMVLGVHLTVIVGVFEQIDTRVKKVTELVEHLPEDTERLVAALPLYLQALATRFLRAAVTGVTLLARPTREYHNVHEFFRAASIIIEGLRAGDEVVVACADTFRQWQSQPVQRWLVKNYEAVERNVKITRIMFSRGDDLHQQAKAQAVRGIRVLLIGEQEWRNLSELQNIPPDMGVAVLNNSHVWWHYGAGRDFRGAMIESPVLAAMVLSVLHSLEAHGEEISPL